jgi:DNA-binding CsgD family transcriptional regulator
MQVLAAGSASFFFFHNGYRIAAVINEVFGVRSAEYMTAGGFRLMEDFQKRSPQMFAGLPADQYPYLFMLRREWVEPAAVNPLTQLFYAPAPRIGFSATERRVLERALLNESDGSIARNLGVSDDTVKKIWRNIHERVGQNAGYLLPEEHRRADGARGQEKRRHLLEYLRTHLEELRPPRSG